MKKKIINGLLFAVALVAATSSFVSCKDYEGDNYAELQEKYASLEEAYKAQVTAMQDYVLTSRYNAETGYDAAEVLAKGTIKARLDELEDSVASYGNYGNRLNVLEDSSKRYAQLISDNNIAIKKAQALAEDDSVKIQTLITAWGKDLDEAVANAGRAMAATVEVENMKEKWTLAYDSIMKKSGDWTIAYDSIMKKSADWTTAYDSIAKRSEAWNNAVEVADSAWSFVKGTEFKNLQELINAYKDADSALQDQINTLNTAVDNILATIKKEVTGIEIQATMNPVYGTFAYPTGNQSNVLAACYGQFDLPVKFPVGDEADYIDEWVGNVSPVTTDELNEIAAAVEEYPAGIVMNDADDNAGKLYLTVNPSNVDFDGKEFTLCTSDNKEIKVSLSALEPCTEQLKWGYQRRANSSNGFYVAKAHIDPANAKDMVLNFNLKETGKKFEEILKNFTASSLADIAKLGLTALTSIQADAPRVGVQASWKDETGWKKYVSKYDLAAVTVKPLGYEFLYKADYSAPIVKIKNKLTGKEKAFEKEIEKLLNIQIGLPETAGNILNENGKIYLVVKSETVGTIDPTQWNVGGYSISGTPVKLPNGDLKLDITSLFNAINGPITSSTDAAKAKMREILNKIINLQNKFFDKAIAVASNPNRYIQPALVGQTTDFGFFYPSRTYNAPIQVKKGTVIKLYPTTLTGEIVAPAYKKYVAVTGAWPIGDPASSDAALAKKLNKANKQYFNTVFDGNTYDASTPFEVSFDKAPAGTVVEVLYECLGYNGKVAGKKYYFEVYE